MDDPNVDETDMSANIREYTHIKNQDYYTEHQVCHPHSGDAYDDDDEKEGFQDENMDPTVAIVIPSMVQMTIH